MCTEVLVYTNNFPDLEIKRTNNATPAIMNSQYSWLRCDIKAVNWHRFKFRLHILFCSMLQLTH